MRSSRVAVLAFASLVAIALAPRAPEAQTPREWRLRVPLDSGEVRVEVTSRAASVEVASPTGTFLQAFHTSDMLAMWADTAAALPVAAGPTADAEAREAALKLGGATASSFSLARPSGDSAGGFVLSGTNGAWLFAMRLSPAQSAAVLGALRGDAIPGTVAFAPPNKGATPDRDRPDVSGAWLELQVDPAVRVGRSPPSAKYPNELRGTGVAGMVRLMFVVDSTGRVVPSSVRLLGNAQPLLAVAARDALLAARYKPAERDGRPVAQITQQDFVFDAQK